MSVVVAEVLGVLSVVQMAIELIGFREMFLEPDSLLVYNAWFAPHGNHSYLAVVVADCFTLFPSFISLQLLHIRWIGNMAADFMAKYALSFPCFV